MVTRSHTQLKEDEITEDLSVCDISEPTLKNFCGKRRPKPRRTVIKTQCKSTLQQSCKTI